MVISVTLLLHKDASVVESFVDSIRVGVVTSAMILHLRDAG